MQLPALQHSFDNDRSPSPSVNLPRHIIGAVKAALNDETKTSSGTVATAANEDPDIDHDKFAPGSSDNDDEEGNAREARLLKILIKSFFQRNACFRSTVGSTSRISEFGVLSVQMSPTQWL